MEKQRQQQTRLNGERTFTQRLALRVVRKVKLGASSQTENWQARPEPRVELYHAGVLGQLSKKMDLTSTSRYQHE